MAQSNKGGTWLKVYPNCRNRYSIQVEHDGVREGLGDFEYEDAVAKAVRLQYFLYLPDERVDICRRRRTPQARRVMAAGIGEGA